MNHETYILDLVEANKGNVQWKLEYFAKVIYKQCVGVDTGDRILFFPLDTQMLVRKSNWRKKNRGPVIV